MRNVTGALAATRLFDSERAEVRSRRRASRQSSERPGIAASAMEEQPRAVMTEPAWAPLGPTPPVPELSVK